MAALTDAQLAAARLELGTTINEDDLQERYDRTQSLDAAITEVLRQRMADLRATPASFNTPDYGQSTAENLKALEAQLGSRGAAGSISVVKIVSPVDRPVR